MTTITLEEITKRYEDVTAVDSVDLEIREGEFIVLVGPSGCGKSTTLRMLSGLESVTEGTIRMDDADVTGVEPKDRNVAMVFQNYALYPHMTAERNMTFGMNTDGDYTDEEIAERVAEAAATLDVEDLLDRKPAELSGGEKQRVAIGRALVRDPQMLLMDEPLSNLDAKLRLQMRTELAELHEELRTTTVYVTHDQTEAMTLGDRVAVLDAGRIQQVDRPQVLYDYPATRFVAEFIGSPGMNCLPVEVTDDGEPIRAVAEGVRIDLPRTADLGDVEGVRTLGIRPEDFVVGGGTADARIEGTVRVREPLGDRTLVHVGVGGETLKVQADAHTPAEAGDPIELGVDRERLHLFDPDSGEAAYHSDAELAEVVRGAGMD
ncbi:ABC transporter ATP-binding protein [Halorarum salinum]|uniref:ABC-type D-xylose/L-arabinose transporter n=1 Tax=Halorarum salinum TaxID=2743089 RepID=A0A7D5Q9E8_9EURY|nr:ABC transporter ATP-binding protein [Halobaculum salinum]QLG60878.1 ABC transporter ATP-binding protein [Halobaculum salinum]